MRGARKSEIDLPTKAYSNTLMRDVRCNLQAIITSDIIENTGTERVRREALRSAASRERRIGADRPAIMVNYFSHTLIRVPSLLTPSGVQFIARNELNDRRRSTSVNEPPTRSPFFPSTVSFFTMIDDYGRSNF